MYRDNTTVALKAIVKICYVGLAVTSVFLFALQFFDMHGTNVIFGVKNIYYTALCAFLLSVPAGYVALGFIDKLLTIVRKDEVFELKTTKYLDIISYCCVYAGIISICTIVALLVQGIARLTVFFAVLALAELFMALLLKVIKKIFAKAIELKQENDLTV